MLRIFNTLTRKKEEFIPLSHKEVRMYACGITAYDDCHIGHARALYIFDVVKKYLTYRGYKVFFARNITDIDDKIINRSKELNISWKELIQKYIDSYHEDLKLLNIDKADYQPRATENIKQIISYIQELINKNYAYITRSGVYFEVRKFPGYGKLSHQNIDEMLTAVRIDPQEDKHSPLDFALWKKAKEGEPCWDSPWGRGRPGWHIECSVMSQTALGVDTLDIHCGGRDLIFPHHENEIAQAEAKTNKPFARYWLHNGLITINEQKMAKSKGNFITIKEILKKYHPDVLKFFYLQSHYSHPLDFNFKIMEEKKTAWTKMVNFLKYADEVSKSTNCQSLPAEFSNQITSFKDAFIKAMDDDFNTPLALGVLFKLKNFLESFIAERNNKTYSSQALKEAAFLIRTLGKEVLGLTFNENAALSEDIDTEEIKKMIDKRNSYRKEGNYSEADKIREYLKGKGIVLEDTSLGTRWRREN